MTSKKLNQGGTERLKTGKDGEIGGRPTSNNGLLKDEMMNNETVHLNTCPAMTKLNQQKSIDTVTV